MSSIYGANLHLVFESCVSDHDWILNSNVGVSYGCVSHIQDEEGRKKGKEGKKVWRGDL